MTGRLRTVTWYAAAAGGVVALGSSVVLAPPLVASVVLALAGAFVLAMLVHGLSRWEGEDDLGPRVARWTGASFALHLGVGAAITSSPALRTYFGGDADQYHEGAVAIASHWLLGSGMPNLADGKEGFYYLLAGLYWAVGPSRLAGLVVNAVLAAALVPLVTALTHERFGARAARVAPALVTVVPGLLLWSSQLLREAGVYCFTAVALLAASRLAQRTRPSSLLALAAALALLGTWRGYIALMLAAGLALALVVASRGVSGVGAGLSGLAVTAALVVGLGLGYSGLQAASEADLAQVNLVRLDSASSAASGYLPDADVSDNRKALRYLPLALPYLVLGPFPWQLASGRQLFGLPDALAWWVLLPSLATGIRLGWRRERRRLALLLVPALALAVVTALVVANFGTMVRARTQVLLVLAPLIALGWSERHPGRARDQGPPVLTSPRREPVT